MVTTPIAYNPSLFPIPGTSQIGDLAIGITDQDYSVNPGGVKWWNGPDETIGYVIGIPIPDNSQPTPISGVTASVAFYRSEYLTNESFLNLSNYIGGENGQPPFTTASQAQNWLINNGYWSSYPISIETYFILFQDNTIMTAQNGD